MSIDLPKEIEHNKNIIPMIGFAPTANTLSEGWTQGSGMGPRQFSAVLIGTVAARLACEGSKL